MKGKIMRFCNSIILASLAASFLGCGSSDSVSYSYVGDWRVDFNIVTDDCGLFDVGAGTFSDEHLITESGASFIFKSELGLPGEAEGLITAADLTFAVSEVIDIFGDGTPCVLEQQVTYSDLKLADATVVYTFEIYCSAQPFCSTTAVGRAVR
jgi:hypothetical protein